MTPTGLDDPLFAIKYQDLITAFLSSNLALQVPL